MSARERRAAERREEERSNRRDERKRRNDQRASEKVGGSGDPTDEPAASEASRNDQRAAEKVGGSGDPTDEPAGGTAPRSDDDEPASSNDPISSIVGGVSARVDDVRSRVADVFDGGDTSVSSSVPSSSISRTRADPFGDTGVSDALDDLGADISARIDDTTSRFGGVDDDTAESDTVSAGPAGVAGVGAALDDIFADNSDVDPSVPSSSISRVRADPLPDTGDDLPRTSADVGGADFRRDTAARDVAEDLTRGGFNFGTSVVSGGLDVIGEGDTADRAVLEGIGGTLAATPGAAATTGVDAAQAFTSITGAGARGGPGAAVDQLTDVSADAFDATAGGLDRTFDINQRTSAGPFGGEITTPAVTTEPGARQDLAVSLTAGALSVSPALR